MDWLKYDVGEDFGRFWTQNGYSCYHITQAGPKFADPYLLCPHQRDGHACAYYAILSVVDVMAHFERTNSRIVTSATFRTDRYNPAFYCLARKRLFDLVTYTDGADVCFLKNNEPLLKYIDSGMVSFPGFFVVDN